MCNSNKCAVETATRSFVHSFVWKKLNFCFCKLLELCFSSKCEKSKNFTFFEEKSFFFFNVTYSFSWKMENFKSVSIFHIFKKKQFQTNDRLKTTVGWTLEIALLRSCVFNEKSARCCSFTFALLWIAHSSHTRFASSSNAFVDFRNWKKNTEKLIVFRTN